VVTSGRVRWSKRGKEIEEKEQNLRTGVAATETNRSKKPGQKNLRPKVGEALRQGGAPTGVKTLWEMRTTRWGTTKMLGVIRGKSEV